MKYFRVLQNIIYVLALIAQSIHINGHSISKLTLQHEKPAIRFKSDGSLKIVNFSDLHYGEAPQTDWGPAADIKSSNVTTNILEMEHPDFVIFTGDLLTAEEMFPNATDYMAILVAPLVKKNYRWASTYGNHDIGENMTRLELLEAEQKFEQSYTFQMDRTLPGVTNYYLPIYPADKDEPVMTWWFFDSQGGRTDNGSTVEAQEPHYIDPAVISWFKDEHSKIQSQWGDLPSLVFFHIPPVEFVNIQDHIDVNPLCSGLVDDDVTPQDKNTGIMQALWEAGGVQAVFVGHDHGNAWCCFYGQIQVCYNRHTGYGGYGTWTRGARIVNLRLGKLTEINSYVRLEDGSIIDEFPSMHGISTTTETNDSTNLGNSCKFVVLILIINKIALYLRR